MTPAESRIPHRYREEERQPVPLRGGPVVIESGEPVGATFHLRHREHPGDQGGGESHDGRGRSAARPLCSRLGEELAGGAGREHLHEMLYGAANLGEVQKARQSDKRDEPWDDHQHDLISETPRVAGPIRAAEVPDDILSERARAPCGCRGQGGGEVFHEGRHARSLPAAETVQTSEAKARSDALGSPTMSEDEIRRAWFLDPSERGNTSTRIDQRRGDGLAWSVGNRVELLVHGRPYFERLHAALCDTKEGDSVSFTDWRGDPDEQLVESTDLSHTLADLAGRGVKVRGLVWRSHSKLTGFHMERHVELAQDVNARGGLVLLDQRVRGQAPTIRSWS